MKKRSIQENLWEVSKKDKRLWYVTEDHSLPPIPSSARHRLYSRWLRPRTPSSLSSKLLVKGLSSWEKHDFNISHPSNYLLLRLSPSQVVERDSTLPDSIIKRRHHLGHGTLRILGSPLLLPWPMFTFPKNLSECHT